MALVKLLDSLAHGSWTTFHERRTRWTQLLHLCTCYYSWILFEKSHVERLFKCLLETIATSYVRKTVQILLREDHRSVELRNKRLYHRTKFARWGKNHYSCYSLSEVHWEQNYSQNDDFRRGQPLKTMIKISEYMEKRLEDDDKMTAVKLQRLIALVRIQSYD